MPTIRRIQIEADRDRDGNQSGQFLHPNQSAAELNGQDQRSHQNTAIDEASQKNVTVTEIDGGCDMSSNGQFTHRGHSKHVQNNGQIQERVSQEQPQYEQQLENVLPRTAEQKLHNFNAKSIHEQWQRGREPQQYQVSNGIRPYVQQQQYHSTHDQNKFHPPAIPHQVYQAHAISHQQPAYQLVTRQCKKCAQFYQLTAQSTVQLCHPCLQQHLLHQQNGASIANASDNQSASVYLNQGQQSQQTRTPDQTLMNRQDVKYQQLPEHYVPPTENQETCDLDNQPDHQQYQNNGDDNIKEITGGTAAMRTNNKKNDTSQEYSLPKVQVNNQKYQVSLNNAINSAGSLEELEGIRHEMKKILQKLEDKINCALVKKALDEFDSSNQHSHQKSKTNNKTASRRKHQHNKKREDAESRDGPKRKKRRSNESSLNQSINTTATQHLQKESLSGLADSVDADESPAGASEFHLITVLYQGALGITIGSDPYNPRHTIITQVDKKSQAESYGLQIGDHIVNPKHDQHTTYRQTKEWLMRHVRTPPASFYIKRKCISGDSGHIYAFDATGRKHALSFVGSNYASIHRFVFDTEIPIGISTEDVACSEGYSYTSVKSVPLGSPADKHGMLPGDIFIGRKQKDDSRLLTRMSESVAAEMISKTPQFEVIRIRNILDAIRQRQSNHEPLSGAEEKKERDDQDEPQPPKVFKKSVQSNGTSQEEDSNHNSKCDGDAARDKGRLGNNADDAIDLASDSDESSEMEHAIPDVHGQNVPNAQLYSIGTEIWKSFYDESINKKRPFRGTIESYDAENEFYKILYEDGDEEELTERQITKLIEKRIARHKNKPLLIGVLSRVEKHIHCIRGYWHFELQDRIPSQTFELTLDVGKDLAPPFNGEYAGHFVHEFKTSTGEVKRTVIKEHKVIIEFAPLGDNGESHFLIHGKGMNQYGIFELHGKARKENEGSDEYNIRMNKLYVSPKTMKST